MLDATQVFLALCALFLPRISQWVPSPDAACRPGEPHPLVIIIEPSSAAGITPSTSVGIHIILRNVSDRTLTIEKSDPELQFSAAVVDSQQRRAGLTQRGKNLYHPPPNSIFVGGGGPIPLAPRDELQYEWQLSDFFDLSRPDTYRVTITRAFEPLKQTISSNTIDLVAR